MLKQKENMFSNYKKVILHKMAGRYEHRLVEERFKVT